MTDNPEFEKVTYRDSIMAENAKVGIAPTNDRVVLILEATDVSGVTRAMVREMNPLHAVAFANAILTGALAIIERITEDGAVVQEANDAAKH